jgi:hypothetical protein
LDESRFWDIVEATPANREDRDGQLAAVRERLAGLAAEELLGFQAQFDRLMADAYTWDLWGAAYLINGGCSDDGFVYFRAWLISRGRDAYSAALRDPDTLAGVVDPELDDHEFEDLWGVAREVYEEAAGEAMPESDADWPEQPKGDRWDFDDDEQVAARLPRLAEL